MNSITDLNPLQGIQSAYSKTGQTVGVDKKCFVPTSLKLNSKIHLKTDINILQQVIVALLKEKINHVWQLKHHLGKFIEEKIKPVPPWSKWALPIVIFRKANGELQKYGDYKMSVNHKVCLDSYWILNVVIALNSLVGIKIFTKIDLKTVNLQISIDNNFKEVMTTCIK